MDLQEAARLADALETQGIAALPVIIEDDVLVLLGESVSPVDCPAMESMAFGWMLDAYDRLAAEIGSEPPDDELDWVRVAEADGDNEAA